MWRRSSISSVRRRSRALRYSALSFGNGLLPLAASSVAGASDWVSDTTFLLADVEPIGHDRGRPKKGQLILSRLAFNQRLLRDRCSFRHPISFHENSLTACEDPSKHQATPLPHGRGS